MFWLLGSRGRWRGRFLHYLTCIAVGIVLDRSRAIKLNFWDPNVQNVDPTVSYGETSQAKDDTGEYEPVDHCASTRAEGIKSRKRRNPIGSRILRRRALAEEFRAQNPLPSQR